MALIISYRIIYLLRNVTPVATRGINEEPNIYVAARSSATQITPSPPPPSPTSLPLTFWRYLLHPARNSFSVVPPFSWVCRLDKKREWRERRSGRGRNIIHTFEEISISGRWTKFIWNNAVCYLLNVIRSELCSFLARSMEFENNRSKDRRLEVCKRALED